MEQLNDMVDQQSLNELALFAGAGGGILGGKLLGWRTVCAVEWEPYPASVLCARQNDGLLPPFPIWDDVQTFDGKPWQGIVDVVSGGFPCQDISAAGKGAGIEGERSGMWREMARIIREVRPRFVFVENSPMLTSRGLGAVLGDLATMGFDAKWGVLGAADVGANHQRDRIWIRAEQMGNTNNDGQIASEVCSSLVQGSNSSSSWQEQTCQLERSSEQYAELANTERMGWQERASERGELENQETPNQPNNCSEASGAGETVANTKRSGLEGWKDCGKQEVTRTWSGGAPIGYADWWSVEPNVGRVVNGVAARMERIKAIGNGQVPLCAATAWRILK
jgi:DNA (cytosine-5)-methyltransferase 1